jgi:hypothetical protein
MEDQSTKKLYLKTPNGRWLTLGGLASCAIPIIIGIWIWQTMPTRTDKILLMPIALTFVFGSVVAAWLGCFKVYLDNDNGFAEPLVFVRIGVKSATLVHVGAGILHLFIIGNGTLEDIMLLLTIGFIIHIFLWVLITLPLSMLCGWVFRLVAIRTGGGSK